RGKTFSQIFSGIMLTLFGWIPARIQLHVLDKWYLSLGDIKDRSTTTAPKTAPEASRLSVKAVTMRTDKANTTKSLNQVIDQSNTVEAVGRLFEASGYAVKRFPRDADVNPMQINLDLYAQNATQKVLAIIKTQTDTSQPADWQTASRLETAAWFINNNAQSEAQADSARQESATGVAHAWNVAALLILVDVGEHESLKPFVERGAIKIVNMTRDDIREILAKGTASEDALAAATGDARSVNAELSAEAARLLAGVGDFRSTLAGSAAQSNPVEV
ncbi:MAG: hypothetical protein WCD76_09690, partial [Pyrinomonadaceae bacterium]